MPSNAEVRARIDEKTKLQAAKVFKDMGLTSSSAFGTFLIRTAAENRAAANSSEPAIVYREH